MDVERIFLETCHTKRTSSLNVARSKKYPLVLQNVDCHENILVNNWLTIAFPHEFL